MAAPTLTSQAVSSVHGLPPLEPGDHLDQKTFHARYEATPEQTRTELIGGVVFMPPPTKARHGRPHSRLISWLTIYQDATPGTDVFDNTTMILGEESEPEPDACLLVLPEFGGQVRENEDGYLAGIPELIAEVALGSESYDLHEKRLDYERAGVKEYLVLLAREKRALWFVRRENRFVPLDPVSDGILRSKLFGGLWLDSDALFRGDTARLHAVLRQGLASDEHSQFLKNLKRS
jgi:Uma2 family endonuclease